MTKYIVFEYISPGRYLFDLIVTDFFELWNLNRAESPSISIDYFILMYLSSSLLYISLIFAFSYVITCLDVCAAMLLNLHNPNDSILVDSPKFALTTNINHILMCCFYANKQYYV